MSAAPQLCENPCETCAKEGLPLLLTRYAVMPSEAKAPRVAGNLAAPELAQIPLGEGAHYGLRLLRSGYVYVFDEARRHWDEYFVTTDGFLSKMPPRIRAFVARSKPATEFACARNGAAPLAGVITVRNPKYATRVWIAFSNAEWTPALFTQHEDATHRARHMRCITVSGGMVAPQAGTAPIEEVERHVPEFMLQKVGMAKAAARWSPYPYNSRSSGSSALIRVAQEAADVVTLLDEVKPDLSMDQVGAAKAFAQWNPHRYNARLNTAQALTQRVQQICPRGGAAIVALHDPVGLVQELAGLMELRKATFMNHERVMKPRFAASTIASLEQSIKEQAKLDGLLDAERTITRMDPDAYATLVLSGDLAEVQQSTRVTAARLEQVAEAKWRTYTHDRTGKPRFHAAASKAWMDEYDRQFKAFDSQYIAPLAKAHASWQQHRCMVDHMSCNFDPKDLDSGTAYTATVLDMMRGVTDKQPSYDLYLKWLGEGAFGQQNLVMRALGLNQTELIDKIDQADAAPVDGRVFPSDAVMGAVAAFTDKLPAAAHAKLTALVAGLSGPALKYWSDFSAGKAAEGKAAAAMAAVSGKQFVRVPVIGKQGDFIQAYMRELYKLDPTLRTRPADLQAAIAGRVKLLEIQGVKLQNSRKQSWYVLLDKEVVAGAVSKNLSGQPLADELATAIRKPEDLKKLDTLRATRLAGRVSGVATMLSGVLLLVNYSKLMDDVEKGMSHELEEARLKLKLGLTAMGGFVSEQTGNLLEKLGERRLRNMMGRAGTLVPEVFKFAGRFAGFGVGVFLGLWDVLKGVSEFQKGDFGLAAAYTSSGLAAVGVATAMLFQSMGWIVLGPWGWAILALGFLIWLAATCFVEASKDNKVQEWLMRCHFGTGSEKFGDTATHVSEYSRALSS